MTYDRVDLHRLVAGIAPDAGPGMTPVALELLEEIVSSPAPVIIRQPRRRPHLAVVIGSLTAILLAVGWLVPGAAGLGPAPASAALDVKREGDHYVVMVRDLFAGPAMYQRELRERGLDVEVRLVPVSPASTGEVFYLDGTRDHSAITAIEKPGGCSRLGGCPVGFRIPVGFRGHATVLLGRAAGPGERYGILGAIEMEGQPFHCVDYVNRTLAEVLPLLRERGVRAEFTSYAIPGVRPSAPADWYVYEGVMIANRQALMLVNPTPNPRPRPRDAFCPGAAENGH